jgi:tetratricopeptide (TPR) repeat protein
VSTPSQRSARAALEAARPALARLDNARGAEDLAADLIDIWSAVEAALRALVGSSALSGQALIREARQRQLINFEQANALAAFEAAHARLLDTSYRPNASDVEAARSATTRLDAALSETPAPYGGAAAGAAAAGAALPMAAPAAPPSTASSTMAAASVSAPAAGRWMPTWAKVLVGVVLAAIVIGGGYMEFGSRGTSDALQQGITAYTQGQRETAANAFNRAVREDPKAPLPHIYLARMAREVGNFPLAGQELQLALQADPSNETALREMGANLLQQGNYDLARRFYVRAVQADPNDKMAQGYLGCTLVRLGRATEAASFLNRAGPGPWSNCAAPAPTAPGIPGATAPK